MSEPSQPRVSSQELINRWVVIALCGATTFLAVGAAMQVGYAPLAIAIIVLGGFVATVVHELGHAIAGWLVGWRVWIIHASPFAWRRADGKIRLEGSLGGPDLAGFVLAAPRTAKQDTVFRDVMLSVGGPLASWLMAIVLIAVAVLFGNPFDEPSDLGAALYALGLLSLVAAIGTSLPIVTAGGEGNDALHIHDKLNYRRERRDHSEVALWLWRYGVEPSDWDEEIRTSVEAARLNPAKAFVPGFFDFIAALRIDDGVSARRALATFAGAVDDRYASILEAYLAAKFDNDADTAEKQLSGIASLDWLEEDASIFHDLTSVEINRLRADPVAAKNALTALAARLRALPYGRGSIWDELLAAARKRLRDDPTTQPGS